MSNIHTTVTYKTLVEAVLDKKGNTKGILFIKNKENEFFLSYDALLKKALQLLYILQLRGLQPGDQLVFQVEDSCDFVTAYWACLLGKIIPVPVTVGNNDEYRLKLLNIWDVLDNPHLITTKKFMQSLEDFAARKNHENMFTRIAAKTLLTDEIGEGEAEGTIHMPGEEDIAFIQFSSGSTGTPKGVVLTHKNLIVNTLDIAHAMEYRRDDKMLSWMPLTHDMGMIGFHLTPLVVDWEQVLMPPQLFIRYPSLWMEKISQTGATITSSPNFGYKYLLKHFNPDTYRALDLSALRIIVNGAEPINAQLCRDFLVGLAPYGLAETAMCPAYGLAEATVAVTFFPPGETLSDVTVDRRHLKVGEKIKEIFVNDEGNDGNEGKDATGDHAVSFVDVGLPVKQCGVHITDDDGNALEDDHIGHLLIRGDNVTAGYYNNEDATNQTITPEGLFKTGDMGFRRNRRLYITGRSKEILFVNGQNYYPHDIERVAEEVEGVEHGKFVVCDTAKPGRDAADAVAFLTAKRITADFLELTDRLKSHVAAQAGLEIEHIIPVNQIPKTTSGKLQRVKLKTMYQNGDFDQVLREVETLRKESEPAKPAVTEDERKEQIADTWKQVLDIRNLNHDDNFFDLGGNSFYALRVKVELEKRFGRTLDEAVLFKHPTVNALARCLGGDDPGPGAALHRAAKERQKKQPFRRYMAGGEATENDQRTGLEIAVIGMAGRFPGANDVETFWENLREGVESISFFSQQELMDAHIPAEAVEHPDYVPAKGILSDCEWFDASFFGYMPVEAEQMDPQVRIFHECAWEALEDAGYVPDTYRGRIGLYAGASPSHRWEVRGFDPHAAGADEFTAIQYTDKDFLATRISYKFNLRGPSVSVYAACSTSLVAVDQACWAILTGKCDMALAGGVSVWLPLKFGYLHENGMIFSSDGHTRAFDAKADGTLFSDGAGICVLKGLQEAVADRDNIYAVIKGTATNNDGSRKAGYAAPSMEGQAEAIIDAQLMARVSPDTIGYVEAHGTGTAIGDPLEVEALQIAFNTPKKNFCALGSVKTNIGHLNAAAGIAGFIKAVLALKHRCIPPCLHYTVPNPRIDFENSPFYVNTRLTQWKRTDQPLRAGVSSYGVGGTNAHVVLEEAPAFPVAPPEHKHRLLVLSARSKESVDRAVARLGAHFQKHPGTSLADAAYTLQIGRKAFPHRAFLVCASIEEAVPALTGTPADGGGMLFANPLPRDKGNKIVFMFPGQGSQYVDMALGLYESQPFFRHRVDHCLHLLEQRQGLHLKDFLYPAPGAAGQEDSDGMKTINRTEFTQPLLFIIQYALGSLLMEWGIRPHVMIGHSIGEYAAACLSGVFSLEDALDLVALRGRLMQSVEPGAMVGVSLPVAETLPYLDQLNDPASPQLAVAAVNGPDRCVVSGPFAAIETLETRLQAQDIDCRRLHTSHAFHSPMMEPILEPFRRAVARCKANPPRIPFISNVSAQPITLAQAVSPDYWAAHIRETVRFYDGIGVLLKEDDALFLEVGPGNVLSTFTRRHPQRHFRQAVVDLVRRPKETIHDEVVLLRGIGQLWSFGVDIRWDRLYNRAPRRRISLPAYSFDRRKFDKRLKGPFGGPGVFPIHSAPRDVRGQEPEDAGTRHSAQVDDRPALATPYVAPGGETQRTLVRIWQGFFGIESIGVRDDFFALGGDSLQAVNILRTVRKETNVAVPLKEFFRLNTIETIARFIDGAAAGPSEPQNLIQSAEVRSHYPLSRSQAAIYARQMENPHDLSFNEFIVMVLEGEPDIERIEATFKKLIRRHESFRTSFAVVNDAPVQRIHEDVYFALQYAQPLSPETDHHLVKEVIRPFDLGSAPLVRVFLIKTGPRRHLFIIDIHNIVIDGVSSGIVLREFNELYIGGLLPVLALQYKDYVLWQRDFLDSQPLKRQEAFWLNLFADAPPPHALPFDYAPTSQTFTLKHHHVQLDPHVSRKVKEFSIDAGATMFITLTAFYFILCAKSHWAGGGKGNDFVVGTPVAGRNSQQISEVVGMFSNVVLLRNTVEPHQTFSQFITRVMENTFRAFENQDYRFEDFVQTSPSLAECRPFVYHTLFAMEVLDQSLFQISGLRLSPFEYDGGACRIPLRITAADGDGRIKVSFRYAAQLFNAETIENMAKQYVEIVEQVVEDPGLKIEDIVFA